MSDAALATNDSQLWVLFLSLFLVLFSIFAFVVCHRACCFCDRYCVCEGWCCRVNVAEYRRERQHLRQLRELRQRHEMELATFTQIPGPIPDSYGFRELRRQSAIRDLTSLGFIVVTSQDLNSLETRNQLTAQQRRDILERLLTCRVYHVEACQEQLDAIQHGTKNDTEDNNNNDVEEGSNDTEPQTDSAIQSYAFPLHEEPETPETTCAICLDEFSEGEVINDASKCPHLFHKACLIEWLDMHDVCPCCRCTMITDTEWRFAATHSNNNSARSSDSADGTTMTSAAVRQSEESVIETVDEENVDVDLEANNESLDVDEEVTNDAESAALPTSIEDVESSAVSDGTEAVASR